MTWKAGHGMVKDPSKRVFPTTKFIQRLSSKTRDGNACSELLITVISIAFPAFLPLRTKFYKQVDMACKNDVFLIGPGEERLLITVLCSSFPVGANGP